MSSDLTASISTRLNGTLAPLDQAAGKVKVLRDRLVEANRAGVDASTSIGRVFGRAAAPVAREQMRGAAEVFKQIGGAAGQAAGKIQQATGLAGGFGRAAIAVGLVTMAYRALTAVTDANIERARLRLEYEDKITQAKERANEAEKAAASEGRAQAGSERAFFAFAGDRDRAMRLAGAPPTAGDKDANADLAGSYTLDESRQAVIQARRLARGDDDITQQLLIAAKRLADTGQFGLVEAMNQIGQDGSLPRGGGATDLLVQRLYRERTGQDYDTSGRAAAERINRDRLQQVVATTNGVQTQTSQAQQEAAIRRGDVDARQALAYTRDPMAVELGKVNAEVAKELARLNELAGEEGPLVRALKNAAMVIGDEGSLRNQLERRQIAAGVALTSPDNARP